MTNALYSTRAITVEHVTISSTKPFEGVQAKLATLAPRIDDGIFTLLRYGESARALRELEASSPLTIFGQRDHGALLAIAGQTRRSIQYDIGNPLTASKMTRHQLPARLCAPIRVLVREDGDGGVGFDMIDLHQVLANLATIRSMPWTSSLIATSKLYWKRCNLTAAV